MKQINMRKRELDESLSYLYEVAKDYFNDCRTDFYRELIRETDDFAKYVTKKRLSNYFPKTIFLLDLHNDLTLEMIERVEILKHGGTNKELLDYVNSRSYQEKVDDEILSQFIEEYQRYKIDIENP